MLLLLIRLIIMRRIQTVLVITDEQRSELHIRAYSKSAKPFRWTYTDPSRRIVPNKIAGTSY